MVQRFRLIVEAEGCRTLSLKECSEFMNSLAATLQVHEVGRLQSDKKHGITILMKYLESSAVLRTWPEHEFMSLDIFLSKEFYPELVQALVLHWFEPRDIKTLLPTWGSDER